MQCKINVSASPAGSISPDPSSPNGHHDAAVNMTAIPAAGYEFKMWRDTLGATYDHFSSPARVWLNRPISLIAESAELLTELLKYTVTLAPSSITLKMGELA